MADELGSRIQSLSEEQACLVHNSIASLTRTGSPAPEREKHVTRPVAVPAQILRKLNIAKLSAFVYVLINTEARTSTKLPIYNGIWLVVPLVRRKLLHSW